MFLKYGRYRRSVGLIYHGNREYRHHVALDDSLFADAKIGALNRFKLRARTYGTIGSTPVFAEVKSKLEDTIIKSRAAIPFKAWNRELVFGVHLPNFFHSERQEIDFLQFRRLAWEIGAEPKVLVRYIRESYVGAIDSYVRVTFIVPVTDNCSWTDFGRSGFWRGSSEGARFRLPSQAW